jgi:hypothetical protein
VLQSAHASTQNLRRAPKQPSTVKNNSNRVPTPIPSQCTQNINVSQASSTWEECQSNLRSLANSVPHPSNSDNNLDLIQLYEDSVINHGPLRTNIPYHSKHLLHSVAHDCLDALREAKKSNNTDHVDLALFHFLSIPSICLQRSRKGNNKKKANIRQTNKIIQEFRQKLRNTPAVNMSSVHSNQSSSIRHYHQSYTINKARSLIKQGKMSRAAQKINAVDVENQQRLKAEEFISIATKLHPQRSFIDPSCPPSSRFVIDREKFVQHLKSRDNGSAAGPSGWTASMLLGITESDANLDLLIDLFEMIINAELSPTARHMLLASIIMLLPKPDGKWRPVTIGEELYRSPGALVLSRVTDEIHGIMEPIQLGVGSPAGVERVVHTLHHQLTNTERPMYACAIDISNAFNTVNREWMLKELFKYIQLESIFKLVHWAYKSPSHLYFRDDENKMINDLLLLSSDGSKQGDTLATLLFCLAIQSILKDTKSLHHDVDILAIADDIHLLSTSHESIMHAFHYLVNELKMKASLTVNSSKCQFINLHHTSNPVPASFKTDVLDPLSITYVTGTAEILKSFIGDHALIDERLNLHADKYYNNWFNNIDNTALPVQHSMLLLKYCGVPKLNYLSRVTPPPAFASTARLVDNRVMKSAFQKLDVLNDDNSEKQLSLPLKMGGWALYSYQQRHRVNYISSLSFAIKLDETNTFNHLSLKQRQDITQYLTEINTQLEQISAKDDEEKDIRLPSSYADFVLSIHTNDDIRHMSDRCRQVHTCFHTHTLNLLRNVDDASIKCRFENLVQDDAHAWCSTIPTTNSTFLGDNYYRLAAKRRLGLHMFNYQSYACTCCNKPDALMHDRDHYLDCRRSHSTGKYTKIRHEAVKNTLLKIMKQVNMNVDAEPKHLNENDETVIDFACNNGGRDKYSDVCCVNSTSPSNRLLTCMEALERRKREKHSNHGATAAQNDATFWSFIVSTHGVYHPEAIKLLKFIVDSARANHFDERDVYGNLRNRLVNEIAIAIQRGNGRIIKSAHAENLNTVHYKHKHKYKEYNNNKPSQLYQRIVTTCTHTHSTSTPSPSPSTTKQSYELIRNNKSKITLKPVKSSSTSSTLIPATQPTFTLIPATQPTFTLIPVTQPTFTPTQSQSSSPASSQTNYIVPMSTLTKSNYSQSVRESLLKMNDALKQIQGTKQQPIIIIDDKKKVKPVPVKPTTSSTLKPKPSSSSSSSSPPPRTSKHAIDIPTIPLLLTSHAVYCESIGVLLSADDHRMSVACLLYDNVHISKQVQSFSRFISIPEFSKLTHDELNKLSSVSDAAFDKYYGDAIIEELGNPDSMNIIVHYLCILQSMIMCARLNIRSVTVYTRSRVFFHHMVKHPPHHNLTSHILTLIKQMQSRFDQCIFINMKSASPNSPTCNLVRQASARCTNDNTDASHHFNPFHAYRAFMDTLTRQDSNNKRNRVVRTFSDIKKKPKMVWKKKSINKNDFNNLINVQNTVSTVANKKRIRNKSWVDASRLKTDNEINTESIASSDIHVSVCENIADRRRNGDGGYEYLITWSSGQRAWMTYNRIYTHCCNKDELKMMRMNWRMTNGSAKDSVDDEDLFEFDELQIMRHMHEYRRIDICENDDRDDDDDDVIVV